MRLLKYHFKASKFLTIPRGLPQIRRFSVYIGKLLFTSIIICGVMIALYQTFFGTGRTAELHAENELLKNHNPVLEHEVTMIEQTLERLKTIDRELNDRLFNRSTEKNQSQHITLSKQKVLLAGIGDFQTIIDFLHVRSGEIMDKSLRTNTVIISKLRITKDRVMKMQNIPTMSPLYNAQPNMLVSGYGQRINPFHKGKYNHPGVDFAVARGSFVYSTAPGTVVRIKKTSLQAGYGNYITIDHGNGFATRYAHLESIKVKKGQRIGKGIIIGTVGSSGGSVAPHLHYEVIRDGEHVDPVHYLLEDLTSDEYAALLERAAEQNQSFD
jgi:hypothetical protein